MQPLLTYGVDMITIRIEGEERDLSIASEEWINQQISRRRADGQVVCVRVTVRQADLNMVLSTPTCGSKSGGRPPLSQESKVLDLWNQRKLDSVDFTGSNLVAFLKELSRLL